MNWIWCSLSPHQFLRELRPSQYFSARNLMVAQLGWILVNAMKMSWNRRVSIGCQELVRTTLQSIKYIFSASIAPKCKSREIDLQKIIMTESVLK